jgi:hypothetical protein
MEERNFRSSIAEIYLDQEIAGSGLRVFHEYVEVAIFVEYSGVEQLVFWVIATTLSVCLDKVSVGIRIVRVFIEIFHIGVGGRTIEVEIIFLDVLSVIALAICKAKQTFFKYWVLTVPQGDGEA